MRWLESFSNSKNKSTLRHKVFEEIRRSYWLTGFKHVTYENLDKVDKEKVEKAIVDMIVVHSKVSHSKPFYPNDSMSLECLDASLEFPIHGVQEIICQE